MKNLLLLTLLLVSFSLVSQAQTNQGAKLVGGTGTLHIGTGNNKGTLLLLSPRLGVFAADDLALGAIIPLSLYAYGGATTTSFGISPFARGYFGSLPTRFLVEGRIGYHRYGYSGGVRDLNENADSFTYGIGVGITHFMSEQVGLDLLLSYDNSGDNDAIFNFSNLTGLNLNVGFQIYLPSGE